MLRLNRTCRDRSEPFRLVDLLLPGSKSTSIVRPDCCRSAAVSPVFSNLIEAAEQLASGRFDHNQLLGI